MHKRAERIPPQAAKKVLGVNHSAREPLVARIDQAVQALAPLRRSLHQRLHPGIAAHDAIECDDIGRWNAGREIDEIADLKGDALTHALACRLFARRSEIGRRDIDARRRARTGLEQLELDRAYATADVEYRALFHAGAYQRVHQRP